jgi:hypothetical protein
MANPTGHQGGLEPTARLILRRSPLHILNRTPPAKRMLAYALRRFACDASIR